MGITFVDTNQKRCLYSSSCSFGERSDKARLCTEIFLIVSAQTIYRKTSYGCSNSRVYTACGVCRRGVCQKLRTASTGNRVGSNPHCCLAATCIVTTALHRQSRPRLTAAAFVFLNQLPYGRDRREISFAKIKTAKLRRRRSLAEN